LPNGPRRDVGHIEADLAPRIFDHPRRPGPPPNLSRAPGKPVAKLTL
jgi:hypothetical protein